MARIDHPLMHGTGPAWADAWGDDEHGPFVDLRVETVSQRLRWCPPGASMMGSPDDEKGRDSDEGPQHRVELSEGFWLADTPVTQALWLAVMGGDNPARFQSDERPVEQVSWDDAQGFIERLNGQRPGLSLALPSEAQWEYACRAGARTGPYAGRIDIRGANNAPGLDPVAWYGGNSGIGFELDEFQDSSGWREKQYPHERAGTHPVGAKAPNRWGLHDMLGNVREWCRDGQRDYGAEPQRDPLGPMQAGGDRVIRGGSWLGDARLVRPAFRDWGGPGLRYGNLGFRLARVRP